MRRSITRLPWLAVLLSGCLSLGAAQAPAANLTQDDGGVAAFLRVHPGYRGYIAPRPPYPLISRATHEQGKIVVWITFAKEGQVSAVKVVKSSGYQNLDDHTVNYIKARWRSTLGRQKTIVVPLTYVLH